MPRTAYLIPKPGLRMRDPKTLELLPPEGAAVVMTSYWLRRVADGDASEGQPPRAGKASGKPTSTSADGKSAAATKSED